MPNFKRLYEIVTSNSNEKQDTITLYMNYLAVTYAFFIPISSLIRATLFSLIILLFLYRRNYIYYLKLSITNPIVQAFLLYLLMHFLWLFGTDNFTHAKRMIKFAEYSIIPLIFLTFVTKEFAIKILFALFLSIFLSELASYAVWFHILPVKGVLFGTTLYQAISLTEPVIFLGHYRYTVTLSIVISILFYKFLSKDASLLYRISSSIFILTASLNLFLMGGRTGYVTFIILLLFSVIYKYKKKSFIPLLITTIFIGSVISFSYHYSPTFNMRLHYSMQTLEKLHANSHDTNSSFGTRLGLWRSTIPVIQENFFFGVGTGDQMDESRKNIPKEAENIKEFRHLHNLYIETLTQFGFIGLLILLNIFYQIIKYKKNSQENTFISYVLVIGMLLALITSGFGDRYYLPLLAVITVATITQNTFLQKDKKSYSLQKELLIYFIILLIIGVTR